jgi:triosephosphate isomerase
MHSNKIFVANWKMNGNVRQIKNDLIKYANSSITNHKNVIIALPNPFWLLLNEVKLLHSVKFSIASQSVSRFSGYGAYTGEISAKMQSDCGIQYGLVGHSERRQNFHETDKIVCEQINNLIEQQITPILCIGEDQNMRTNKTYINFIVKQLDVLNHIKPECKSLMIAYEPIWAIGTGVNPDEQQLNEIFNIISTVVQETCSHVKISYLYGGSVTEKNSANILRMPNVNGVLVGGASVDVDRFISICNFQ